ncbi:retrovirus-related pol polyprotein from transposon TNT 1-94 [Tanacetum coccineum]
MTHPGLKRNMVPKAVLIRTKAIVNAYRPKVVLNTVRGNQVNAVKNSACWVWKPKTKDQGVIDSGFSRHMIGNMSYLNDFEEINGGYVAFGGNPKGGKITAIEDETSGILKSFITGVENLIDQRVKVIRTPQQNGVAERKNRTLTEAARTMLADSKLPTTFWAEAVNTACYVQNRVLVTKPHNKTPYELLLGRKPALGFMRPFRCPVIIINTIDHLGKFDSKADEGFFIGYSINSKAFRVFNSRTRIVEENLYVQFSENTPNIAGSTKACDDAGKARMKTVPGKEYILLSLWPADLPFSQNSKSSLDAGDNEKKVIEELGKEGGDPSNKNDSVNNTNNINTASDQNSTNNVNTVSSTVNTDDIEVNVVSSNTSVELPNDPNMSELEDIMYSNDYEDVSVEADMNNLNTFMLVSPIPTTRIHKDHPVEQIIRDLNSEPQTRRITNNLEEHGLFSSVQQRTNHKDFQNCLFACFSSQKEPKKEVYVCQPLGFEDPNFPDRVYKVEKALYGLHQAPRDDIIFGSTKKSVCTEFEKMMHKKFQMSSMGELIFFLGLQVKQKKDGIFINQDKDSNVKKLIQMIKNHTAKNVADLLTKAFNKGIGVNAGDSKLMLLGINLLLLGKVNAARHNLLLLVIVDFLNASSIKYALTVNPTIYTLCIEQLWSTVKEKTVNMEVQLQALVDGKKIVVTKATVRRDLQLEDAEGVDCLPNATIFEQLTLIGYEKLSQKLTFYKAFFSPQWKFLIHTILQCLSAKTTTWNEFSSTTSSVIICLSTNQKFNFSMYIFESMVKNLDSAVKFLMQGKDCSGRVTPLFPTMVVEAQEEIADKAVTEEPSMQLKELMNFCTKLQQRVLDLENTKISQAQEITSLKKRVKSLGDQEDTSKQGRKINDIDADAEITLVDETRGRHNDDPMFDTGVLNDEEVFIGQDMAEKEVSIVDPVTTASEVVTIANVEVSIASPTAATITTVELTLAQTLAKLKSARPKTKGVVMQEISESITTTTTIIIPSKDKGKGIMVEETLKMKKKDQISFDEQEVIRLQAEFDEEVRLVREKDKANVALIEEWNDIQAKIEADKLLAERLQAREQEELTIEERAKLFQQLLEKRRKFFAAKRTEEKRNKPPTKAQ